MRPERKEYLQYAAFFGVVIAFVIVVVGFMLLCTYRFLTEVMYV